MTRREWLSVTITREAGLTGTHLLGTLGSVTGRKIMDEMKPEAKRGFERGAPIAPGRHNEEVSGTPPSAEMRRGAPGARSSSGIGASWKLQATTCTTRGGGFAFIEAHEASMADGGGNHHRGAGVEFGGTRGRWAKKLAGGRQMHAMAT